MTDDTAQKTPPAPPEEAQGFPCARCGSQMRYVPEHGGLYCAYCGTVQQIDSREVVAPEYLYFPEEDRYDAPRWEEKERRTLFCPSCGAETVLGAATVTATCPFCGANYVTQPPQEEDIIQPETLIPFRVGEGQALAQWRTWVKKRHFAPGDFRKGRHVAEMKGLYIPYWTYDSVLYTRYRGYGGERHTERYTVRANGHTETRTRTEIVWRPLSGEHRMTFDNIPCPATDKLDRRLLDQVGPYSLTVLHVYDPAYLAGFLAERYSVGLGEGFAAVRQYMERSMVREIERCLGYDEYRGMQYQHRYEEVRFKHVLLPLWLSRYTYRGKNYLCMINGESGRVAGRAPVSVPRVLLAVLGGCAALLLLCLFFYYFFFA